MTILCALLCWGLEFSEFNGVNLSPARLERPDLWRALHIGWARVEFSWTAIQPNKDKFSFEEYDKIVLEPVREGINILGLIAYSNHWAISRRDYFFIYEGLDPTGKRVKQKWEIIFPSQSKPIKKITDLESGVVQEFEADETRIPPNLSDWLNFVEKVVSRYSRPPFNIRYWQVWNEFNWPDWYYQTAEHFLENVHIPAAKIIRKYGCKVVLGGWACTSSAEELVRLLSHKEYWHYVDIIDFHYLPNNAFQILYDVFIKEGKCQGIWSSEIGWTMWEGYLPNCYSRLFYWALLHSKNSDQYKLFWFHIMGYPGQPVILQYEDKGWKESFIGKRLRTLANLLPGDVKPFNNYSTEPALPFDLVEEHPSSEGFKTSHNIVIACHLGDETLREGKLKIRFPNTEKILYVRAFREDGQELPMETIKDDKEILCEISLQQLPLYTLRFEAKGITIFLQALTM